MEVATDLTALHYWSTIKPLNEEVPHANKSSPLFWLLIRNCYKGSILVSAIDSVRHISAPPA